jgi:hypothetical protein
MELSLPEQLLLVAFDPKRGRPDPRVGLALGFGLAGAVAMDLVLRDAASLQDGKLVAGSPTGDPILDDALDRIRSERRPRDLKHWVKALTGRSVRLRGRLLQRLVERGVLAPRTERVLGLFRVERHTLADPTPQAKLMEDVRQALVGDAAPEPRTASLIALMSSCGLVDRVVSKEERSAGRSRAKAIASGDLGSRAVSSAVADVQAAVMAGVTAAIVSASVTSGSSTGGHGH